MNQSHNNKLKKGVLVIKRESINRQNSASRSPEPTQASPFVTPEDEKSRRGSKENCYIDPESTQKMANNIIRKTIGQLKRGSHLLDSNFGKSEDHSEYLHPTMAYSNTGNFTYSD